MSQHGGRAAQVNKIRRGGTRRRRRGLPECLRRMGLSATVMQRLERAWNQQQLSLTTKLRIYSTCVYYLSYFLALSPGLYSNLNGTS